MASSAFVIPDLIRVPLDRAQSGANDLAEGAVAPRLQQLARHAIEGAELGVTGLLEQLECAASQFSETSQDRKYY